LLISLMSLLRGETAGNTPDVVTVVRTLMGAGFTLINTVRKPSYLAFTVRRFDEFAVENRYLIVYPEGLALTDSDADALVKVGRFERAAVVLLGEVERERRDIATLRIGKFLARLGGPVTALLPLDSAYPEHLQILGHNTLPDGLTGEADDRFEEYVHAGLQFLLHERVIRYGQERLFEIVPDGFVFGRSAPLMLYDAKAATNGYDVSRQSLRQFADYVRRFHAQYEQYTGRLHCFILVSGHFNSDETLQERSNQLYAECNVPLCFLTACEMAEIVKLMADRPSFRQAIDWRAIFANHLVLASAVGEQLAARLRDGVIPDTKSS
jgi:hypothetical protein